VAITAITMAQVQAMRISLNQHVDERTREQAQAWNRAWAELAAEYQAAAAELIDAAEHGWPTRTQVLRSQRVANALKATLEAVQDLTRKTGVQIAGNLPGLLSQVERWQQAIATSQVPLSTDLAWARVDRRQLDAIVNRTTGRIVSGMRPLPGWIDQQVKSVLVRGVALGDNPDAAAARIIARCRGQFDGGMYRARLITRTEILDAHRNAATEARKANPDTITGWRWHADLGARTCPSCLSQNGSLHPADEGGPYDHPQGRCTAVPVTKTWAEMGIDLPEPPDQFPDARAWFDGQPADVQQQIMGRERLSRLNNGELSWDDLSQRRENPGWRPSYSVAPLR